MTLKWIRSDLHSSGRHVASVAEDIASQHSDLAQLMTTFSDNYNDLINIKRLEVFRQDIPQSANFRDAIDILIR